MLYGELRSIGPHRCPTTLSLAYPNKTYQSCHCFGVVSRLACFSLLSPGMQGYFHFWICLVGQWHIFASVQGWVQRSGPAVSCWRMDFGGLGRVVGYLGLFSGCVRVGQEGCYRACDRLPVYSRTTTMNKKRQINTSNDMIEWLTAWFLKSTTTDKSRPLSLFSPILVLCTPSFAETTRGTSQNPSIASCPCVVHLKHHPKGEHAEHGHKLVTHPGKE